MEYGGRGGNLYFSRAFIFKLSIINSLYIQRLSSNESPHLVESGTHSSAQSRLLTKDRWTQVAGRPCQTPRGEAGSQSNKTSFLCSSAWHFKFQISPFEIKGTNLEVLKKLFIHQNVLGRIKGAVCVL